MRKFKLQFLLFYLIFDSLYLLANKPLKAFNVKTLPHHQKSDFKYKSFSKNNNFKYLDTKRKETLIANNYLPSEIVPKNEVLIKIEDLNKEIISNSSDYKAALQRVDQAKSRLLAAISLKSPTIDLTSNGLPEFLTIDHKTNPNVAGTSFKKTQQWKMTLSASVRWDIINPTRNPQINAAKKTFEKAKNSFLIVSRDLDLQAKIAFLNLYKSQQMVTIAKNSVNLSFLSLKDARLRNKALVATDLEVLEAENQLSRDQIFLSKTIRDNKIAKRSLANSLGMKPRINIKADSKDELIGVWENSIEASIAAALKNKASLINHNLDVEINKEKSKEELGRSKPSLSLINTFSVSKDKGQTEVIPPVDRDDYERRTSNSIGLFTEWKIFDAGRSRELSNFYKKKSVESKYKKKSEEDKVIKNVEDIYNQLETATHNIYSNSRDILKNKKMLEISRMRFKAGVTNQREIVNAQRDLKQSNINYIDSLNRYNINLSKLQRETGIYQINKCPKNDFEEINSKLNFNDIRSVDYPIISLEKACEASVNINKSIIPSEIYILNDAEDLEVNSGNINTFEKIEPSNKESSENIIKDTNINKSKKIKNNDLSSSKNLNIKFEFKKYEESCSLNLNDDSTCLDEFL